MIVTNIKTTVYPLFILLGLLTAEIASAQSSVPNILIVVADDLGFSDIEPYGGEIRTPTLSAIADEGVRLTNFHTHALCTPTRAMLMSGINNHVAGVATMAGEARGRQKGAPGYEAYLRPSVVTIAELLSEAGYQTWMSGKWDLGGRSDPALLPNRRGFDRSFVLVEGSADFFRFFPALAELDSINYCLDGRAISPPEPFYITDVYTDYAIEFLDELDADQPFFGYLTYTAPHYPLQAPREYIDQYRGAYDRGYDAVRDQRVSRMRSMGIIDQHDVAAPSTLWPHWGELTDQQKDFEKRRMEVYASMVTAMDHQLGRVLEKLRQQGRLDNTLILFMSDNGPEGGNPLDWADYYTEWAVNNFDLSLSNLGNPYSFAWTGPRWAEVSATPFNLYKGFASEGGTRVPAIARWPEGELKPHISDEYLHVLDIPATILAVANVEHPGTAIEGFENRRLEGRNVISALRDDKDLPSPVHVWEMLDRRAVRKGPWKLTYANRPWGRGRAWSLFNVERDPGEQHDLSDQHPEIVGELLDEWLTYVKANGLVLLDDGIDIRWTNVFTHFNWAPVPSEVPVDQYKTLEDFQ
jgi:arylsulfatase A-like enzyme